MVRTFEGGAAAHGLRVAIVVSRFNEFISRALLDGALAALRRSGASEETVEVAWVPGAFEIPLAALHMARSGRYDAVVCLGAVIRGETPHFEYVAQQVASGVAAVARETGLPVSFGVLTTETLQQAVDRAGGKAGNKGADAALAAVETANLLRALAERVPVS